jgi:hypothetical protein
MLDDRVEGCHCDIAGEKSHIADLLGIFQIRVTFKMKEDD